MAESSEKSGSDRICNLPQPLLHRILSFLPTLYVVQTCVLSKYWRNVWWSLPTLNFQEDLFKDFESFAKFVDVALLFRDGSNVTKLSVSSTVAGSSGSKVNGWILYAMRHNIQVLDMRIFGNDSNNQLLLRTFNCESLRKIKLCGQSVNIPSLVCLPALRVLHITDSVVINAELLTNLCSSSSFLESLILEQCTVRGSKLTISSSHLRYLKMSCLGTVPIDFVISSPNLISLYLNLYISQGSCILGSNHFLMADAIIKSSMHTVESVIQLTSKAKNVQTLFINLSLYMRWSIPPVAFQPKDISILNHHQLSFCNLKSFGVLTWFTNIELAVINNILKWSPQIESILFICKGRMVDSNCYEEEKIWSKYNLSHLKFVEIQRFTGIDNEVKMVKFLLGNAVVLEKMIIRYSKDLDKEDRRKMNKIGSKDLDKEDRRKMNKIGSKDLDKEDTRKMNKIAESLLSCPRASPSVGILFVQDL